MILLYDMAQIWSSVGAVLVGLVLIGIVFKFVKGIFKFIINLVLLAIVIVVILSFLGIIAF